MKWNAQRFFTSPIGIIIAASGATFLWGSSFPFIKLSYESLHIAPEEIYQQFLFAGYRFFLASLLIGCVILLLKRTQRITRSGWKTLGMIALFQTILQYIFFYVGLSYSTGVQGSIIAGTTSFFQILIAHFMYKNDALSIRKGLGLLLGFAGVILVTSTRGSIEMNIGIGEILLLLAMFAGALGNILAKNGSAKLDILFLTSIQMMIGSIVLILIGASQEGLFPLDFDLMSFLMLLYLAFVSAMGFVLWNTVMKYNKVGSISTYLFLIPVFGVFLSSLMLKEELHGLILLSLALVVSGIIIVNREKKKREDHHIQKEIVK